MTPETAAAKLNFENTFHILYRRTCGYGFRAYMTAEKNEVEADKEWARSRKSVKQRFNESETDEWNDAPGSARACLTKNERINLDKLEKSFPG
eukprot:475274-Lingulodinium_polyedra.AAC.1